jgi:proline dehydrogenase
LIYAGPKAVFHALSRSARLKRLASLFGMTPGGGFARRFVAGETLEEAVQVSRRLQGDGYRLTLDYLGESVKSFEAAQGAAKEYVKLTEAVVAAGIERNISLKLTQLGADIDLATCVDNMRRIMEQADRHECFVRIDMENSPYTDRTLEVFNLLWQRQHRNVGVALQACLKRTDADLAHMNRLGARVRLVKGAYKEPPAVAYQEKADVDAAFVRQMRILLDEGTYPAIATHDPAMIEATQAYAASRGLDASRFEFQMLYGVRRDLQRRVLRKGHRVRLYVPFGREWFPYFMRRLGERPANVGFVLKSLVRETLDD